MKFARFAISFDQPWYNVIELNYSYLGYYYWNRGSMSWTNEELAILEAEYPTAIEAITAIQGMGLVPVSNVFHADIHLAAGGLAVLRCYAPKDWWEVMAAQIEEAV